MPQYAGVAYIKDSHPCESCPYLTRPGEQEICKKTEGGGLTERGKCVKGKG